MEPVTTSPTISSLSDYRTFEHLSMPDEEIRARMKALTGPANWFTGFPLREMARRIKYPLNKLRMFRDGRDSEIKQKYKLGPTRKKRLVDLLLKIECGMLTCICTREKRSGSWWRTSICKRFIESPVPTKAIRPVHRVLIDRAGPTLAVGAVREKKVLPSFLGAFGNNSPTSLPTKLLLK